MTQLRHHPPSVDDERALMEQWRGLEQEALSYMRSEQPPDGMLSGWVEAFGANLARRERDILFTEFLKVEESFRNYADGARPVDQELLLEVRDFADKLSASGVD